MGLLGRVNRTERRPPCIEKKYRDASVPQKKTSTFCWVQGGDCDLLITWPFSLFFGSLLRRLFLCGGTTMEPNESSLSN